MNENIIYLSAAQGVRDAVCVLEKNNFSCIPVCGQNGELLGVVWQKDIVLNRDRDIPLTALLSDCYLTLPLSAAEDDIVTVFSRNQRCNTVYIVDENRRVRGLLSKSSVLSMLLKPRKESFVRVSRVKDLFSPENEFLMEAFGSLHEGIVVVDRETRVLFVNESYTKILGVKPHQVLHKHLSDIEPNARILSVLKTGIPVDEERIYIESLGITIIANINPILINEEIEGAISSFFDITEILALANELRTTNSITAHMQSEIESEIRLPAPFNRIVSNSMKLRKELALAARVAATASSVLIIGESGTGKELVAEAIHQSSPRKDKPFIKLNCSAIPESLFESELFGYEEGSFTGAKRGGKKGKVELADTGTLFLDEIGDLPLSMQPKLLRFLQEGTYERVGGVTTEVVDTRIIAATNRDLDDLIRNNAFRRDLFYRINTFTVFLYPLAQRKADIVSLVRYYTKIYNDKYGKNTFFSNRCMDLFLEYNWPGNVRELMNVVEHSVVLSDNQLITEDHLPFYFRTMRSDSDGANRKPSVQESSFLGLVGKYEKELILEALFSCGNNKTKAADLLGMSRRTFYNKLAKYHIVVP